MTEQSAGPSMGRHPSDGTLRAYLDHELTPAQALRCALHVRRCPECQTRRDALRRVEEQVSQLIGAAFEGEGGERPGVQRPARRTGRFGQGMSAAAAAVVAAVVTLALHRSPATHTQVGVGGQVEDICCFNLDGGTRGDDGLLTVSRPGQVVDCVVVYEDETGTRAFSPRDPVRFVSQPAGCGVDAIVTALAQAHRWDRSGL